jgi:replicative DNA helicase
MFTRLAAPERKSMTRKHATDGANALKTYPDELISIESEAAVLGSMILDRECIPQVLTIVRDEFFFSRPEHRHIYNAILALYESGSKIDLVLIRDQLIKQELLSASGGTDYAVRVAESVPTAANWEFYSKIVRDKYVLRSMLDEADKAAAAIRASGGNLVKAWKKVKQIHRDYQEALIYDPDGEIDKKSFIQCRKFSDIKPLEVEFLIPEILPRGVITSLVAQEGIGKSCLAGKLAADISIGRNAVQGDVIIFAPEEPEGAYTTRLLSNGGDMDRVQRADKLCLYGQNSEEFDFERHIQYLDKLADGVRDLKLVILDPITAFTSCNENSNSEVRRALQPLIDFATKRNVSILALSHLNKKVDLGFINRTIGSRAWSAVPRIVWGIQEEQNEDEEGNKIETNTRFMLQVKNNLATKAKGMKFYIEDGMRITFDTQRYNLSIDGISGGIEPSRANEIGDWLIEQLGADSVPAIDIAKSGCDKWGISRKRFGEIAKQAGINKRFSVANNRWEWSVKV